MTEQDTALSPFTGLTRDHWADHADRLLLAVRPFADDSHARIRLPGPVSGSGERSDHLEAFARTFLTAGFRLVGEHGADPHDLAGWYAEGLAAGTGDGPTRWPALDELQQTRVEAASLALVLGMTRPWLWDLLSSSVQEQVVAWLQKGQGQRYPENNWQWFRVVTASFVRSVGGDWRQDELDHAFELSESCYVGDGWYTDGHGRNFDHYCGWAWHLYPLLWEQTFPEAREQVPAATRQAWRDRLSAYVDDALHLVGSDGAPLMQGRSLVYRYATTAPLWVAALTGATEAPVGQLRRACSGTLGYFLQRGVPDEDGLLNLGWTTAFPPMRQGYSGFGSPYWASKGLLGLAMPADHPVWTSREEALPVEQTDTLRVLGAPGWVVSGTRADGVVRVLNHGTDHGHEQLVGADSPVYARLGYSTATAPPVGDEALRRPGDNAVVVLDARGRASHRSGFRAGGVRVEDGVAIARSSGPVHWLELPEEVRDYNSGRDAAADAGPVVSVTSLVRAGVEVRLVHVEPCQQELSLELSGWPLVTEVPAGDTAHLQQDGLHSLVLPRVGDLRESCRAGASSMLGATTAVPLASTGMRRLEEPLLLAVVVALGGEDVLAGARRTQVDVVDGAVEVRWADGHRTSCPPLAG